MNQAAVREQLETDASTLFVEAGDSMVSIPVGVGTKVSARAAAGSLWQTMGSLPKGDPSWTIERAMAEFWVKKDDDSRYRDWASFFARADQILDRIHQFRVESEDPEAFQDVEEDLNHLLGCRIGLLN